MTAGQPAYRTAAPSGKPARGLARLGTRRLAAAPVTAGLLAVVSASLEPAHLSVWLAGGDR